MAVAALVLYLVAFGTAFVARAVAHRRRTGDTGFRGLGGRPGSAAWLAGLLFVAAVLTGVAAPIAALAGLAPFAPATSPLVQGLGVILAVAGLVATLLAQAAMGASWRVGVDEDERTALVTAAFSAWSMHRFHRAARGGSTAGPRGREPYLRRVHGPDYERYATTVGRFLPRTGRRSARAAG